MCRGGDVGDRKMVAGEPAPTLHKIADIVEMMRQIGVSGANRLRVGLPMTEIALHHLFAEQVFGDFEVHLAVEPGGQPPHLGTVDRVDADQQLFAVDLVEIFDNRRRIGEHGAVGLDQHRHFAGRVEGEKFRPPLPDFLGLQREIEVLFPQHDAHLARRRGEHRVVQNPHRPILTISSRWEQRLSARPGKLRRGERLAARPSRRRYCFSKTAQVMRYSAASQ